MTGITFNPQSSGASPGGGLVNGPFSKQQTQNSHHNFDGAATNAYNFGHKRASAAVEMNTDESIGNRNPLGDLISVKPKKLHTVTN